MKAKTEHKYKYQAHHSLRWLEDEHEKKKAYEALDWLKDKTKQETIMIESGFILAQKQISKKWVERFYYYCEGLFAANFFEE